MAANRTFVGASAPLVRVADTTGAGDGFTGAFAAALDRGQPWPRALAAGAAAGSLACTDGGAQLPISDAADIATPAGHVSSRFSSQLIEWIRMIRVLRNTFCIALGALFLHALPARAQDYTDIWWAVPKEDGWGVNLIQSQDFIFATFFVYGPAPAKTPMWYAGNLTRGAGGSFTGGLYQTSGTGIGAPWNPADHPAPTRVGDVTFTPTSSTTGTLVYNVGAIVVNKSIVRQTLTSIALGGSYFGSAVVVSSGCSAATDRSGTFDVDPVVTQNTGGQMSIALSFGSESCTMQGAYAQEGTLFRIPTATYVCTNGGTTTVNTTSTVYELKATNVGIEGRWSAPNVSGCVESASFSAVFP